MALTHLRGKTAFITGAASGMGRGMARVFAQQGVNIALADIDLPSLEEARDEIAKLGVDARGYLLDVSDRAQVYEIADAVEKDFGKVHIVCNNAGVGSGAPSLDETPDEIFDWMFAVNTMGPIHGFKAFAPKLKKHGEGGHIVNTASIAGMRMAPGMNNGIYAGTKFAVVALSFAMRTRWRRTRSASRCCVRPASTPTSTGPAGSGRIGLAGHSSARFRPASRRC